MAIKLTSKANTVGVSATYPFGNIKDRVGSTPGTAVNTINHADFHQFFEKMMNEAGITHNGLPDNQTNSFQLFTALAKLITPDFINITPPAGSAGVLRYRKYGNRVSIECALTGLDSGIDTVVTLPISIVPAYSFYFTGNNGSVPSTFQLQLAGVIVKTGLTEAYFILEYFLD